MKKFLRRRSWAECLVVVVFGLLVLAGYSVQVLADTAVSTYKSDLPLEIGLIVALDQKDPTKAIAAPARDPSRLYGVVVDPRSAPVTLSQTGGGSTYVATSGNYPLITSDENGPIKAGDYISLSSLDGIAAKATDSQNYSLGRALSNFDGRNGVISTTTSGHHLGLVQTQIAPGKNPLAGSVHVPGALRSAGDSIAGKPVSTVRLYLALLIFAIAVIAGASLLYSSIRAALTAIGRNPLSQHTILLGLYQAIAIGLAIFGLGLFGVYLLLKL